MSEMELAPELIRPASWQVGSYIMLRVVNDGEYPDTVLFDSEKTASNLDRIKRFVSRWGIEIADRETKHLLGSADPQCRTENSVQRAPLMVDWWCFLMLLWFADQFGKGKDFLFTRAPWRSDKHITFSDMLAAARRSHMRQKILVDPSLQQDTTKYNVMRSTRWPNCRERAQLQLLSEAA